MLGTKDEALEIHAAAASDWPTSKRYLPKGWSFVGSGGTRAVYKSPSEIAYKVGDSWSNRIEVKAASTWRKEKVLRDHEIVIPKVHNFKINGVDSVNAMEYVENSQIKTECAKAYGHKCNCRKFGTARWCFEEMYQFLYGLGFQDMFYGNVLYGTDKLFHIVDLGCESDYSSD